MERPETLAELEREITSCRSCPRLVEWREKVAWEKRAAYADEEYWGRPVPGFGDPGARVIVFGLAPAERDTCLPYAARELALLYAKVVVCLGAFAWDAALRLYRVRPKPKFAHGTEHTLPSGLTLLGCYHPSQQNTFTGVLTEPMLDAVLLRARELTEKA